MGLFLIVQIHRYKNDQKADEQYRTNDQAITGNYIVPELANLMGQ